MFWRRNDRDRDRRREEILDSIAGLPQRERESVIAEAIATGEIDAYEGETLLRTAARLDRVDVMTLSGLEAATAPVTMAHEMASRSFDPWFSDGHEPIGISVPDETAEPREVDDVAAVEYPVEYPVGVAAEKTEPAAQRHVEPPAVPAGADAQLAQLHQRVWAVRRARRAQMGLVRRRSGARAPH